MLGVVLFVLLRWCDILFFVKESKTHKYVCHTIYYVSIYVWEITLLLEAPWFTNWSSVFQLTDEGDSSDLVLLLVIQTFWYIHSLFESLLLDQQRSDYAMMVVHHLLTILLIQGAYNINAHRLALLILVEQDTADVLINICKLLHKADVNRPTQTALMIILNTAWWITRVLGLGMIIWYCFQYTFGHYALKSSLILLLVMQVMWGIGLFRITRQYFHEGVVKDTLENKD